MGSISEHWAKTILWKNVFALKQEWKQYQLAKFNKAPNKGSGAQPQVQCPAYLQSVAERNRIFQAGILPIPIFWSLLQMMRSIYVGSEWLIGQINPCLRRSGAQYDKDGNCEELVDGNDFSSLKPKTQAVDRRYDTFTVLDSVHCKSAMTIGWKQLPTNGGILYRIYAFKMTKQDTGYD